VFADKIISHYGDIPWPARSPDFSACDFFLWGFLKSRMFATRIPNLQTLKARIQEEVEAIAHRMLASVIDISFVDLASVYHIIVATYLV
jgi:hypothetical protein